MNPYVGLAFDILMLAALGYAIYFGRSLSQQIRQMQSDRKAFEQLIQALNLAAAKAEAAVHAIKDVSISTAATLNEKIGKAKAMSEELEIMVQAGDNLAERLNTLAEKTRKTHAPDQSPAAASTASSPDAGGAQPRSRAEKELMEALKAKQSS